jgi:parvulin-like peptidyl-prolyl isomerase
MPAPGRLHCLLALSLLALPAGLCGCQTRQALSPINTPPANDFAQLTSMAGNDPTPRGQSPERIIPTILEIRPEDPGSRESRAVRIRATVNGEAILDEEVHAAAFQQLVGVRSEKEKEEILAAKLQEIIDREVILQDASAKLGSRQKGQIIAELKRYASKEFERQWLHKMMRNNKIDDVEQFSKFMRDNGMPLEVLRRQWERNFISMEYVRSRIEPTLNKIGHLEVVEYYEKHPKDFQIEDSLVWQDLFVAKARHASPEAARQFADVLLTRIRKGEDFYRLSKQFDNGDSCLRENAEGIGHKRGEIKPLEAEGVLWAMKPGQAALIELPHGYHIVKLKERQYSGPKPFDDKVQKEIKDKLKNEIFLTEMKRLVNELKRKAQIIIANEVK